jgi:membrane protein DedA with SNARE-associated domain
MEGLIARFGLIAIFLGACVEGDLILVLGGVTAHLGLVDLPLAIGAGAAGCLTGDLVCYAIGRSRAAAIQRSRVYRAVGPAVERMATRLGRWQILAARVMYGTRVATMLFWGAHRLSLQKFVVADIVGCAAWAGLLGMVGYAASSGATVILGEVKRVELWLLGAACTSVVAFLAGRRLVRRQ